MPKGVNRIVIGHGSIPEYSSPEANVNRLTL